MTTASAVIVSSCRRSVRSLADVGPRWRPALLLTGAACAACAACADFGVTTDPAFGLPDIAVDAPSLSRDVQPIFDKRCAYGGCHSVATAQAGLVLVSGLSAQSLINRPARLNPGQIRVVPSDASRSWLMAMIGSEAARRPGVSRMPLAASPLTANQIATIQRWIERGAPLD